MSQTERPTSDKAEAITAARRLMRGSDRGALATALRNEQGWPYPSLVLTACDYDGAPILFISGLAEHTRNIAADPRVGLLFEATAGLEEPLTGPRVMLAGRAVRSEVPHHRARFLARHPSAVRFTELADFAFYRVEVERAHLVAGFGRARWLMAKELLAGGGVPAADLAGREADALGRLASAGPSGWTVTGIDPDGVDLRRGAEVDRREFPLPPPSPDHWCDAVAQVLRSDS